LCFSQASKTRLKKSNTATEITSLKMGDPCSGHIFKMSLKQQPVVEASTGLNDEGMVFSSFKVWKPERSFGILRIHCFKLLDLKLGYSRVIGKIFP